MWQKNSFRAFLTFKTIAKSQFWFWTTGWKSNHWYGAIPVNVKTTKKKPTKICSSFLWLWLKPKQDKFWYLIIEDFQKKKNQSWNICFMWVKIMHFHLVFFFTNIKFSPTWSKYFNFVLTLNFCPSHACFRTGLVFTLTLKKILHV